MKKIKVAINGFGRIGRLVLRAVYEAKHHNIEVVAINDLTDLKTNTHLFKYDSIHGSFNGEVTCDDENLIINGHKIQVFSQAAPENLPWKNLGVELVMECSGHFTEKDKAALHLKAGAKKVLISAPASADVKTVVYGVNHETLTASDFIVSNASCTTNCLAPLAHVIDRAIGMEKGYMTTIHSYTGDQRLVDTGHKDLRRSRAAALSMIPTSTGAAKAVGLVLPHLKGKLDGVAIRVPTPNVSLVDFKFVTSRNTSVDEINKLLHQAAEKDLKGILEVTDLPLVSIDFNHNHHSSIVDLSQTAVVGENLGRISAWYDNEWGFSNRMLDTATVMANLGHG